VLFQQQLFISATVMTTNARLQFRQIAGVASKCIVNTSFIRSTFVDRRPVIRYQSDRRVAIRQQSRQTRLASQMRVGTVCDNGATRRLPVGGTRSSSFVYFVKRQRLEFKTRRLQRQFKYVNSYSYDAVVYETTVNELG
jgi:hypothetical protein